jgi:hypothetical protein
MACSGRECDRRVAWAYVHHHEMENEALGEIVLGEIVLGEIVLREIALGEIALGEIALGDDHELIKSEAAIRKVRASHHDSRAHSAA